MPDATINPKGMGDYFMDSKKAKKATDNFKVVIENEMQKRAANDALFAKNFNKEGKNIDDCVTYILNQVKLTKMIGFDDETIFGLAAHYYDEDDIDVGAPVKCHVVSNHHIELTEEEIQEAKKDAKAEIHHFEKIRLTRDAEKEFKASLIQEQRDKLCDEELVKAQSEAKQQVIDEERQRLTRKPAKARMTVVKNDAEKVVATQKSMF